MEEEHTSFLGNGNTYKNSVEPIPLMAQIVQQLGDEAVESIKEYLRSLIALPERKYEFISLQSRLDERSDLTHQTLLQCHKIQQEFLVAIRTVLGSFLSENTLLLISELVEVFLLERCRNIDCRRLLPVKGCDCKICSVKKGFCSACMCLVCLNFDSNNTCSWISCDACLCWCHAVCGIQRNLTKPGPILKGPSRTTEMQFYCLGCGHASEMFGFVKDVFVSCGKEWGEETLMKELDCVLKIFQGSEDLKGKELHVKADVLLTKQARKMISRSDTNKMVDVKENPCENNCNSQSEEKTVKGIHFLEKSASEMEKIEALGGQGVSLSYFCENSNLGVQEKGNLGKDLLYPVEKVNNSKIEVENEAENRKKKAKIGTWLSLALPDVSLSLVGLNRVQDGDLPANQWPSRSIQENYGFSVGSHKRGSDQIRNCGEGTSLGSNGLSDFSNLVSLGKHAVADPPASTSLIPESSFYDISSSSGQKDMRPVDPCPNDVIASFTAVKTIEDEWSAKWLKKDDVDSLESVVHIKEAEARMFQSRADDARGEVTSLRQLAWQESKKLNEAYDEKISKLCLEKTEERLREKLEELKALESARYDFCEMKVRLESEIAGLLNRMEAAKKAKGSNGLLDFSSSGFPATDFTNLASSLRKHAVTDLPTSTSLIPKSSIYDVSSSSRRKDMRPVDHCPNDVNASFTLTKTIEDEWPVKPSKKDEVNSLEINVPV